MIEISEFKMERLEKLGFKFPYPCNEPNYLRSYDYYRYGNDAMCEALLDIVESLQE